MTRGMGGKAPANIQGHLKGVHYPADKDDLVTAARTNGAPKEVIDVIQRLPAQPYGGPQEVMKAYGELNEDVRKAS